MPARPTLVAAAVALAVLVPPGGALGQEADRYRGDRAVQTLDDAVERAWMLAQEEAPRAEFTTGLHRLMREMSHLELRNASAPSMEQFQTQYRRARRALLRPGGMASDRLLDAWDDVTAAWVGLRRRVPMGVEGASVRFEGQIGGVDMDLTASTLADLHEQCVERTRSLDLRTPQRMEIREYTYRVAGSAYDGASLCSVAALNAVRIGARTQPLLSGTVEDMPFVLYGPPDHAIDTLRRYMPSAIRPMVRIDDVFVEDRRYHALDSWTAPEVVQLLERQLIAAEPERLSRR